MQIAKPGLEIDLTRTLGQADLDNTVTEYHSLDSGSGLERPRSTGGPSTIFNQQLQAQTAPAFLLDRDRLPRDHDGTRPLRSFPRLRAVVRNVLIESH
jgi:hypothetical protein